MADNEAEDIPIVDFQVGRFRAILNALDNEFGHEKDHQLVAALLVISASLWEVDETLILMLHRT